MAAPRYKPRSELRTRGSDKEHESIPDFAATALDRPAATEADLRQAKLKQNVARDRSERAIRRERRGMRLKVAIVMVTAALLLGSLLGAYLAYR